MTKAIRKQRMATPTILPPIAPTRVPVLLVADDVESGDEDGLDDAGLELRV